MDKLRWILLAVGLGVIAVVYFVTRFQIENKRATHARLSPQYSKNENEIDVLADEMDGMNGLLADDDVAIPAEQVDSEQVIVISIMARQGEVFQGLQIVKAFNSQDLQFGDMQIYHRISDGKTVFNVASAVKPGVFEVGKMGQFSTPGISMFLQLPGPVEGTVAFDDLILTANNLATELNGTLQDRQHKQLNQKTIMQIRQSIIDARQP
ncbi:MAG: cell division protein ZipA C-terminal FtsZ-binding domain-containing protein [Gammaproteobacteria bacterium]